MVSIYFGRSNFYFRMNSEFKDDNEIDDSNVADTTTNIYKKILYVMVII